MEMRKDYYKECYKEGGQVMNEELNKLKKFILETRHGIILVDDKLNERRFKKKDINNLFYLLDDLNIKEVKYIPEDLNMFLIAEIKIKTLNNELFTIQLEKHYKLY
jgi:hypothetical protein